MAKDVKAGKAGIELGVIDRVDRGLQSASKKFKRFGRGMMTLGASLTAGMVGLMAGPVKMASDAQETMAKFDTVFGKNAKTMETWSNNTAKAMGVSRTEMAKMLGSMQDLLVPMGVVGPEATDMTKGLSKLAVDLGSFNNMRTEDTFRDMMAAMTGSSEVLAKYGVVVNETLKKQEALRLGLINNTKEALTPAMKAQATYSLIMAGTTAAQGDAVRTQDSFANQMKRLKATAIDLGTSLGQAILPAVTNVVAKIGTAVGAVTQWAQENPKLIKLIGMAAGAIAGLGVAMTAIGGTITVIGVALGGLLSPIGLVIAALVGAGGLAAAWLTWSESGQRALKAFQDRFGPLVKTVKTALGAMGRELAEGNFAKAWEIAALTLEAIWLDLTGEIRNIWGDLMKWMASVTASSMKVVGALIRSGVSMIPKAVRDRVPGLNVVAAGGQALQAMANPLAASITSGVDQARTARLARQAEIQRRIELASERSRAPGAPAAAEAAGEAAGGPEAAGGGGSLLSAARRAMTMGGALFRGMQANAKKMIEELPEQATREVRGRGTFSSAAALRMSSGMGGPEKQTADNTAELVKIARKQWEANRQGFGAKFMK